MFDFHATLVDHRDSGRVDRDDGSTPEVNAGTVARGDPELLPSGNIASRSGGSLTRSTQEAPVIRVRSGTVRSSFRL
jgi:hypothetical protein